jgi:hypothetical protein
VWHGVTSHSTHVFYWHQAQKSEVSTLSLRMIISRPSNMAEMIFCLAFSASLQTVFLETFILLPVSSKESFSKSISLRTSTSADSRYIGSSLLLGVGSNFSVDGTDATITGFGCLPDAPRLRLLHQYPCLRPRMNYVIYHKT